MAPNKSGTEELAVLGWGKVSLLLAFTTFLGRDGCLFQSPPPPSPPPAPVSDLATDVTVVATPSHRLIATPDEAYGASRLVALQTHIESASTETFVFDPDEVTVLFGDGTVGRVFDRPRAGALLEELEVAPTESAPNPSGELAARFMDRDVQLRLKQQLMEGLLNTTELGTEPIKGYLLVDMNRRSTSLDGVILQIKLVRNSDGAVLRQLYRFSDGTAPAPTAQP